MLFPSLAFIYIFLPVFLILYFINHSSLYRNLLLLIGSLVFYAWGEPVFVLLLMAMILVNWGAALWIEKHKQASQPHAHADRGRRNCPEPAPVGFPEGDHHFPMGWRLAAEPAGGLPQAFFSAGDLFLHLFSHCIHRGR
jgi:vacuolar-type H+-ATPase subunit I/STV1